MPVHFNSQTPEKHFLLRSSHKSSTKNIINQAINQILLQNIYYSVLLVTHQRLRQRNEQSKVNERASVTFSQAFYTPDIVKHASATPYLLSVFMKTRARLTLTLAHDWATN